MKPNFIVRTTLDKPACKALARHQMRKLKFLFFSLDLMLTVCVVMLWVKGSAFAGLASVVLLLLVGYTVFSDHLAGSMIFQSANHDVGETEYSFAEDGVTAVNRKETSRIRYGSFLGVHETEGHYFLYIQKNLAIILPKSDFVSGDPAGFEAFIAEKLGKPVLRSRS